MEKLSRISKIVDKFLSVGYWLLATCGMAGILAAGALCIAYNSNDDLLQEKWTIGVGNMDLELADHVINDIQVVRTDYFALIITLVVGVVMSCYIIKVLKKILAPMIQGKPFAGTVSGDLRKLGWVIIGGSVIMSIMENLGKTLVYAAYDIKNLLLSENIVGVKLEFYLVDIKTILLGVLVLLLSHVFCYGEKLQQQDDETL